MHASEVRALFATLGVQSDPLVVDRIVELEASIAEIREATNVDGNAPERDSVPSTDRVAEIRALLAELLDGRHLQQPGAIDGKA